MDNGIGKSYQSFMVNEDLLAKVVAAIKEGATIARKKGQVQSLEVFYEGHRQHLVIGTVMIVPPAVADSYEDFPLTLLYGTVLNLFSGEELASILSCKLGESKFDEYSQADLKTIKDEIFKNEKTGRYDDLVIFIPAWSNPRDYVGFKLAKDEKVLTNLVRHLIFSYYFDPGLSSSFNSLMTDSTNQLDVVNITPKLLYPHTTEYNVKEYPNILRVETGEITNSSRKAASEKLRIYCFNKFAAEEIATWEDENSLNEGELSVVAAVAKEFSDKVFVSHSPKPKVKPIRQSVVSSLKQISDKQKKEDKLKVLRNQAGLSVNEPELLYIPKIADDEQKAILVDVATTGVDMLVEGISSIFGSLGPNKVVKVTGTIKNCRNCGKQFITKAKDEAYCCDACENDDKENAKQAAKAPVAPAKFISEVEEKGFKLAESIAGYKTYTRGDEAFLFKFPDWVYAKRKSIHFEPKMEGENFQELKKFLATIPKVKEVTASAKTAAAAKAAEIPPDWVKQVKLHQYQLNHIDTVKNVYQYYRRMANGAVIWFNLSPTGWASLQENKVTAEGTDFQSLCTQLQEVERKNETPRPFALEVVDKGKRRTYYFANELDRSEYAKRFSSNVTLHFYQNKSGALSPFFYPGQVIQQFYPELQHEIVDYPNYNNSPMINDYDIPDSVEGFVSTAPAGGLGVGRDGKPQVLDGAPLRKEPDIRGYMFNQEFYNQYNGIPAANLTVASLKKTAGKEEFKEQFSKFLKLVVGEVAATFISAFKVTQRPILQKVPGSGQINLIAIESLLGSNFVSSSLDTGSRVKYLLEKMNDGDLRDCINDAFAQASVWNKGPKGFIYEVFVRLESIDIENMTAKYKFITGSRDTEDEAES